MFIEWFLYAFTTLFVITDPLGVSAIYFGLTRTSDAEDARSMAVRGVLIATCIMLVFAFIGESLLSVLGISSAAFRIAGGLFLFYTAFFMVTAQPRAGQVAAKNATDWREDYAVFPLAIPLLSGPGCMTTIILLMGTADGDGIKMGAVVLALGSVMAIALLFLLNAARLQEVLGKTGGDILTRIFGMLLAALSIQFIADGVKEMII